MRRHSNDLGALVAIVLGALLAEPAYEAVLSRAFHSDLIIRLEPRPVRRVIVERPRAEGAVAGVAVGRCEAPFEIDSRSGGFRVVGEYAGVARLEPEGLVIDLIEGATTARFEDADVRGVVLGWAQASVGGQWSVTHASEPIPLGELREGTTHVLGAQGVLIPGVGPAELADGWLVVEHVLDAPDAGGTAWTYAHAPRGALAALQNEACLAGSLLP